MCEEYAMNSFWGSLNEYLPKCLTRVRSQQSLIFLLALGIIAGPISFGLESFQRATAQYAPMATSSGNPWQYASFPVENFQQYTSGFGPVGPPLRGLVLSTMV